DEIKQLKSEKELNEKKQSEEISKINNNNLILKQQLDNLLTQIEQLKKDIKSKNEMNQINSNDNEDKKEDNSNNQVLQSKSDSSSTVDFDLFRSSSRLLNTFYGHVNIVYSIDYSTFDGGQYICSSSWDNTVCVWDIDNKKQIQSFNGHLDRVYRVKFSPYHYQNSHRNIICSSSHDNTIRFWNVKNNEQLQIFNEHNDWVGGVEFSPFNGGRYLFSGSGDKTIRIWDVETYKSLHVFNGHEGGVWCMNISPLQSNNNNNDDNKSNSIGVIGGNGYTICSGSFDKTIRIWDIETAKQSITFKGHQGVVRSVKYGPNELRNIILSGAEENTIRLWDIRSGEQTQVFNGHTHWVWDVEYPPFVIKNGNETVGNVICSGSIDSTIRFWDIRSNKKELHLIKGGDRVFSVGFVPLKKKINNNEQRPANDVAVHLCGGLGNGLLHIWG
ncbi:WD-repeat protein, partial [Reticulomyxa filosa]